MTKTPLLVAKRAWKTSGARCVASAGSSADAAWWTGAVDSAGGASALGAAAAGVAGGVDGPEPHAVTNIERAVKSGARSIIPVFHHGEVSMRKRMTHGRARVASARRSTSRLGSARGALPSPEDGEELEARADAQLPKDRRHLVRDGPRRRPARSRDLALGGPGEHP